MKRQVMDKYWIKVAAHYSNNGNVTTMRATWCNGWLIVSRRAYKSALVRLHAIGGDSLDVVGGAPGDVICLVFA